MTTFSRSPRILKGTIIYFDLPDIQPHLIVFRYNPATLSRTQQMQTTGEDGQKDYEALQRAPAETLSVEMLGLDDVKTNYRVRAWPDKLQTKGKQDDYI